MITFLTKSMRANPLGAFLRNWAGDLGQRIRTLSYSDLASMEQADPGAYVFTGVDELVGGELELARRFADRLKEVDPLERRFRVLNDPSRSLPRYELMQALYDAGINRFRAFRHDEVPEDCRYPVFLRRENAHTGALTSLVPDRQRLRRTVRRLLLSPRRYRARDLLVTEFLDTEPPDGVYRKYGVTKVGDRLIPRHVLFSGNWVTKFFDEYSAEFKSEEHAFVNEFPQHDAVARAFDIAGIDYGRIDFGVLDGQIQVWEINTNPTMAMRVAKMHPERVDTQTRIMGDVVDAIGALDAGLSGPPLTNPFAGGGLLRLAVRTRDAFRRAVITAYRKSGLRLGG